MSVEKYTVTQETSGFTTLPNQVLQNLHSIEALGLWCYLASLPPGWIFYKDQIKAHFHVGRDKLERLFDLLQKSNLIEIQQVRKETGLFSHWHLHVKNGTEFTPFTEIQETVNQPFTDLPLTVNQLLVSASYKGNINKSNKHKKKKGVKANDFVLPDWLPKAAWDQFIAHRKLLHPPLTPHSKKLAITKLEKLKAMGADVTEIINQTILNGWKGIFPIRSNLHGGSSNDGSKRKSNAAIHYDAVKQGFEGTIFDEPTEDDINPFK